MVNVEFDNDKFWSGKTLAAVEKLQVALYQMSHGQLTLMVLWLADRLEAPKDVMRTLIEDSPAVATEEIQRTIVKLIARAIESVAKRVGAYSGPNRETTIALEEILFQTKAILTLTETT